VQVDRTVIDTEQAVRKRDFLEQTQLNAFENQKHWFRMLHSSPKDGDVREVNFAEFSRKTRLELPHFVGLLSPFANFLVRPLDTRLAEMLDHVRGSKVEILPDGMVRLTVFDKKGMQRGSYWIDSKRLVVTKIAVSHLENGQWNSTLSCDFEYEYAFDFDLPVHCSYSRNSSAMKTVERIRKNDQPAVELGTVSYQWLQVNADEIPFASVEELGMKPERWEAFLSPPANKKR
jgi:hypothetical protein